MLKLAGYINFAIAIGHIFCLIWADTMFKVTGIYETMQQLAQTSSISQVPPLPTTMLVKVVESLLWAVT